MRGKLGLAVLATAMVIAGCGTTVQGNGRVAGSDGGRAKINLNVKCDSRTGLIGGSFTYTDESVKADGRKLSVRGTIPTQGTSCDDDLSDVVLTGTYRPRDGGRCEDCTGTFNLSVRDGGKIDGSTPDGIGLQLSGGTFDGYNNARDLDKGNVRLGKRVKKESTADQSTAQE